MVAHRLVAAAAARAVPVEVAQAADRVEALDQAPDGVVPVVATVAAVRVAVPMVGEAPVAPVVRAGMAMTVRAVSRIRIDRVVHVAMMTVGRVVRAATATTVRAAASVTMTVLHGRSASRAPRLSAASAR